MYINGNEDIALAACIRLKNAVLVPDPHVCSVIFCEL